MGPSANAWSEATVINRDEPHSYDIETNDGSIVRLNRFVHVTFEGGLLMNYVMSLTLSMIQPERKKKKERQAKKRRLHMIEMFEKIEEKTLPVVEQTIILF